MSWLQLFAVMSAVAIIAAAAATSVSSPPLPPTPLFIEARGTTYEVGVQVGKAAAQHIQYRWSQDDIQKHVIPFVRYNSLGVALMKQLFAATSAAFPHLIDECRGIADGVGLTIDDVFLLNSMQEVTSYMARVANASELPPPPTIYRVGHCTDVLARDGKTGGAIWGHNEDGSVYDRVATYFVNATITDSGSSNISFFCLTYPGAVCANAFGWNSRGLAFSFNAVFPDELDYLSPPVQFVARRIVEATTPMEVRDVLFTFGSATGKNANAFSTRLDAFTEPMASIEVSPQRDVAVRLTHSPKSSTAKRQTLPAATVQAAPTHFYHVNIYQTLATPCLQDPSSLHRLAALNRHPAPASIASIRAMLGDTSDPQYPVYRNGTAVDHGRTVATAVFNFPNKSVAVWWDANPNTAAPQFDFALW